MQIKVIGPRDHRGTAVGTLVNTTSKADGWSKELSPFFLGPVPLYGGYTARRLENGYQRIKVFAHMLDADGNITDAYWAWAREGWAKNVADRYPMGKGVKPLFSLWDGERLSYIEARLRAYFPMYRDAARKTEAFAKLQKMAKEGPVTLWDFDGFDHESLGMSLRQVFLNPSRSLGHAFVIKAMLMYGPDVKFEDIEDVASATQPPNQLDMF
jgi:hypothetical protein